jgi:hypothetical protein
VSISRTLHNSTGYLRLFSATLLRMARLRFKFRLDAVSINACKSSLMDKTSTVVVVAAGYWSELASAAAKCVLATPHRRPAHAPTCKMQDLGLLLLLLLPLLLLVLLFVLVSEKGCFMKRWMEYKNCYLQKKEIPDTQVAATSRSWEKCILLMDGIAFSNERGGISTESIPQYAKLV